MISVIATILNEGDSIRALLESLAGQSRPPDEIVLVDGGSHDHTLAIVAEYQTRLPLTVLQEHGCNISQGRNLAIQATQGPLIAVTDAGTRLPSEWLEHLIHPFEQNPSLQLVAGFFRPDPDPHNPFEVAMSATVLPLADEIQAEHFLPSSRSVAFTKTAWEAVGGYPEWLDYCEDLIFDLRLKARFGAFHFAPQAVVDFKPRTTWQAFYKQYYLYARGDGKADLWRKRHAARYLTYGLLLPAILLVGWFWQPLAWLLLLLGGAIYLKQPYQRLTSLWGQLGWGQRLLAILYIPMIRVVGDLAKMLGYPVGRRWRWQNHPPNWKE
jgi:glycosyltransferase involved in cell wall biosynthesis